MQLLAKDSCIGPALPGAREGLWAVSKIDVTYLLSSPSMVSTVFSQDTDDVKARKFDRGRILVKKRTILRL